MMLDTPAWLSTPLLPDTSLSPPVLWCWEDTSPFPSIHTGYCSTGSRSQQPWGRGHLYPPVLRAQLQETL